MTLATAVKERPILFSGPMVRAILDGSKTQTRRIVKPQPRYRDDVSDPTGITTNGWWWTKPNGTGVHSQDTAEECMAKALKTFCPYSVGMELWVRETWAGRTDIDGTQGPERAKHYCMYRADGGEGVRDPLNYHDWGGKWKPSIFMPRWACRIELELTDVRCQRVQETSHEDADAEGIHATKWATTPLDLREQRLSLVQLAYSHLWDEINGKGSWESNPWVWALSFKMLEGTP